MERGGEKPIDGLPGQLAWERAGGAVTDMVGAGDAPPSPGAPDTDEAGGLPMGSEGRGPAHTWITWPEICCFKPTCLWYLWRS